MSSLKVEIDEDKLDELFVEYLKNQIRNLEHDFKTAWHPEDRMMFIQVHAACLTLLQWMTVHIDFEKFMEEQYGSNSDQRE